MNRDENSPSLCKRLSIASIANCRSTRQQKGRPSTSREDRSFVSSYRHSHKGTRKPVTLRPVTDRRWRPDAFCRHDNERRRTSLCFQRKRTDSVEKKPGFPRFGASPNPLQSERSSAQKTLTSLASVRPKVRGKRHLKASDSRY